MVFSAVQFAAPVLSLKETLPVVTFVWITCMFQSVLLVPRNTPDDVIAGYFVVVFLNFKPTTTPIIMAMRTATRTADAIRITHGREIPKYVRGAGAGAGGSGGF